MRSSSHIRVWTCAVVSARGAAEVSSTSLCTSTRRHFSTGAPAQNNFTADDTHTDTAASPPASTSSPPDPPQRYRRRSSDPQTVREKGDFRRDYKYARHRPLPDAPWRQLKTKTYLDDAERLYGRKETWHTVGDAVLREKLVAILQDYLRDTLAAARLEAKDARRYHHLCATAAREYRAHVSSGAFGLAEEMQAWARDVLRGRLSATAAQLKAAADERGDEATGTFAAAAPGSPTGAATAEEAAATSASAEERAAAEFREERRRRGAQAVLESTAALADVPDADVRHKPQSAFPFLRRRAVEDETTLDPSLVDWTAKYFPEDDARTFAEPPKLRARTPHGQDGRGEAAGEDRDAADASAPEALFGSSEGKPAAGSAPLSRRAGSVHARHRLHRTLRDHENRHRATFDAEGVYYKVVRQSDAEERAPRPQPVKASDVEAAGRRQEVVKVPWSIASRAKAQGYSSDTLRAKERLIRLTRGEDPETIP